MSHFKEYQSKQGASDGRSLGDEWLDWDGKDDGNIEEGAGLFVTIAASVTALVLGLVATLVYLTTPRLATWHEGLPRVAWIVAAVVISITALWFVLFALTIFTRRRLMTSPLGLKLLFDITFSGVFKLARLAGVSRDRVGHSFVKASNNISRAFKPRGRDEKLLLLLPRCLTKEQLKQINGLRDIYPLSIHIVSGGELARKKVKEVRPTAIIGVACERDLVSGIRDVGTKFSVIGIPNRRPDGPCQNTHIDMTELIETIEFFVGPPRKGVDREP
jgi:hypothetical protein